MKRSAMLSLVMILSLCTINPMIATAETFCDVYFGTSLINADDSYIKLNGTTLYAEDESEAYAVFGFRYGTWLDNIPCLGVALDLSLNGVVTRVNTPTKQPLKELWDHTPNDLFCHFYNSRQKQTYPFVFPQVYESQILMFQASIDLQAKQE